MGRDSSIMSFIYSSPIIHCSVKKELSLSPQADFDLVHILRTNNHQKFLLNTPNYIDKRSNSLTYSQLYCHRKNGLAPNILLIVSQYPNPVFMQGTGKLTVFLPYGTLIICN